MAIRDTYAELLTQQILKEILETGGDPSAAEIVTRFEDFTAVNDISKPLFLANNYKVSTGQASSATLFNSTNNDILRDLKVLYKHLFKVSDVALNNFSRWRTEGNLLEGRLNDLEERISSLLLIASDTAGFVNFMQDNFVDNSKIDLSLTDALVNVDKGTISIGTATLGVTRIDLNDLTDQDIEFTVLSRNNLVSTISVPRSRTSYVITDQTNFWQERVYTSKPGPVSVEVKVDLKGEFDVSRIDIDLHQANANSTVQVTPMLSTDNFNFTQLPIATFTRSILDKSTFQFPGTKARYIKFLLSKSGFDLVNNGLYSYEFGIDEISFYKEEFLPTETGSTVISQPLFVTNTEGNPEEFSKLVLETCEDVPEGTTIEYSVAVSNDPTVPLNNTVFVPIDPLQREIAARPTVLDFGELEPVTERGVGISYDVAGSSDFINPSRTYSLIQSISGTTTVTAIGSSSAPRYSFLASNNRILSHNISPDVAIAQGTLEIWRNVSTTGTSINVRGRQAGWGFEEPYFKTTVSVSNPAGVDIDFGGKAVIVDGSARTGKINIEVGRHSVLVHKDNWKAIEDDQTTLSGLKVSDGLYPYNHRYLTEGYAYPTNYSALDEQIYRGFDIVAEFFAKEVSVFDLNNNVKSDNYEKYAVDTDAADSSGKLNGVSTMTEPAKVFLLRVDENNPDFVNEDFLIRFKAANSTFKYARLKAVLKTTDVSITPFLDSYRIKITS